MTAALGRLGWAPEVFWRATPHEFWAAYEGWTAVNGIRHADTGLTGADIDALEALKKRFPDRPAHRG